MAPAFRASHADRQAVIEALEQHTTEGRLDLDEYTARVGLALAAVTLDDLAPLLSDLPGTPALGTGAPSAAVRQPTQQVLPLAQPSPSSAGPLAGNHLLLAFAAATAALLIIGLALAIAR